MENDNSGIRYTDTHSHLYDAAFDGDRNEAMERAAGAGVTKLILPGIEKAEHGRLLEFHGKFKDCTYPATGLHPTSVKPDTYEDELGFVVSEASKGIYCAIGEIGIDAYWSKEFLDLQCRAFEIQLELASSLSLPVIIHAREATEQIINILKSRKDLNLKGVFHAYTGSYETYSQLRDLGDFRFGIGGVVTFKNASIAETVKRMDLSNLLLETDSPYLTPVPFRGKRNESSYIPYIAGKIAELQNCDIKTVAETTNSNAEKLFGI